MGSVDMPVKPTFREFLKQCSKTVASWPRWKRDVLGGDINVYACEYRATCWKKCGAKEPHFKSSCDPCPFRPHAKCEKLD